MFLYIFFLLLFVFFFFFFFSSRRRHTRCSRDWSSDVCSSDLAWRRLIGDSTGLAEPAATIFTSTCDDQWLLGAVQLRTHSMKPKKTVTVRSEERRVGKECRSRWWPEH